MEAESPAFHDVFKALSGSDGTLKMWDVSPGTLVRDLLSNVHGIRKVVFEGRWCVAARARHLLGAAIIDVWDFGKPDDDWIGEPVGGIYDEEMEQGSADAMGHDLDVPQAETERAG
jgi:F-box and WD-40 domain protein CDC4